MAVDWTDPCARATALREAYFALVSGDRESLIRTRTGEGEREVRFQAANLDTLKRELTAAEAECKAVADGKPRRFAFTAG